MGEVWHESPTWGTGEDFHLCVAGDEDACRRFAWTYYVWPLIVKRLQEIERRLRLTESLPVPVPRPDPPPVDVLAAGIIAPMFFEEGESRPPASSGVINEVRTEYAKELRKLAGELEKLGKKE